MARERYQGVAGDRVQSRSGVKGIVLTCRKRGGGTYLKAKLADGQWLWPNQVIAESSGAFTAFCGECAIEYRTDAPNSHTCPNCVARERRDEPRDGDTGSRTFSRLGKAPSFTPAPVQSSASDEQRERIERGRSAGGDEPY